MNDKARELRSRLALRQQQLKEAEADVKRLEEFCQHQWSGPQYTPIERPGYSAPNYMGPIRDGKPALPPIWVPPETTPRWTRECLVCGKTETTTRTDQHVTHTPKF